MWDCRCRCRCRGRWWSVGCLLIGDVHNVPRVARSVVADELGALLAKEIFSERWSGDFCPGFAKAMVRGFRQSQALGDGCHDVVPLLGSLQWRRRWRASPTGALSGVTCPPVGVGR